MSVWFLIRHECLSISVLIVKKENNNIFHAVVCCYMLYVVDIKM